MIDFRALAADIGVHVSDETLDSIHDLAIKQLRGNGCWSCLRPDGGEGWRTWLKSRLAEMGLLRARRANKREAKAWVVLHVFPIHRKHVPLPGDDKIVVPSQVARSDIVTGHLIPRPIDRVACRVAPGAPPTLDELLGEP